MDFRTASGSYTRCFSSFSISIWESILSVNFSYRSYDVSVNTVPELLKQGHERGIIHVIKGTGGEIKMEETKTETKPQEQQEPEDKHVPYEDLIAELRY